MHSFVVVVILFVAFITKRNIDFEKSSGFNARGHTSLGLKYDHQIYMFKSRGWVGLFPVMPSMSRLSQVVMVTGDP